MLFFSTNIATNLKAQWLRNIHHFSYYKHLLLKKNLAVYLKMFLSYWPSRSWIKFRNLAALKTEFFYVFFLFKRQLCCNNNATYSPSLLLHFDQFLNIFENEMLVFSFGKGSLRRRSQQNFKLQGFLLGIYFCDPLVPGNFLKY